MNNYQKKINYTKKMNKNSQKKSKAMNHKFKNKINALKN